MQLDLLLKDPASASVSKPALNLSPARRSLSAVGAAAMLRAVVSEPKPVAKNISIVSGRPEKLHDTSEQDALEKAPGAFKTISEAATLLGVQQHVLRFWESKFPQIKPLKLRGGRRYYRPEDMALLAAIQQLLYKQGYTIKGARKLLGSRPSVIQEINAEKPQQPKPVLTEQQRMQLSALREELLVLQRQLLPKLR